MKVKKIAALAVGAAMVGATIGLASAQPTVPEIPKDFFVKDGQPNVKIVVGSQGAALDVSSAADIAVALGTMLYTTEDVKVKDASVVVKKDTAYDPDDIPVFDNTYTGEYRDGDNLQDQAYWWNGSFDADGNPIFSETLDNSAWEDGIFDQGWDVLVPSAIEWKDGNNNNYWQDPNGEWHSATDVMLHYTVNIGKVTLKQLNDDPTEYTDIDDFSDFTLIVDNVVANVTFAINAYEKTLWDPVLGATGTTYTVSDLTPSYYSLYESNVISGVEEGDTIDLFGKTVKVLDIGSDYIEYGNDWGETYIDAGTTKTFGDYTIKVLDIDVNQAKALLEVSGPAGSETITLNTDDNPTETLFNGGIRVTLKDTFIGIGGTTSVKVEVQTDISYIEDGDEFIPGWIAHLGISGGKLNWFALTNKEELEGKEVKLFDTYVMDYQASIMKKKNPSDDKTYAAMEAWVVIDPLKPEYATETLSAGDELEGWTIDEITATADPAQAAVVSKITTPITVLDTEVMEQGLDNVDSNLILIGGPVVNSVTAALAEKLEVPSDYDGWKEEYGTGADSGVVKYVAECGDINGYGVVLVAGTDREGTAAAAKALMEYLAGLS
ncbi:S-layer protein [Thermococcus aciditolerans]|uniref:S-layer protein n=1 Tax=Thermococcus aciditolerans TaxID=2598455 RepID=A0A5C0SNG3_9EURY|nr:S-layer protein [Thermococcus aciditolerans]QEK14419.1 S-layer protein [Thermococcus aciditolerans]